MKMPAPHFLMANPDLILTTKTPKWWLEDRFHLTYNLLLNIYKRLNTNVCKRVLNEYKHFIKRNIINNQMFMEIIRVESIGELRK